MKPFIGMGLVLLLVTASVSMTAAQELVAQQSGKAIIESAASAVENAGDTLRSSVSSSSEPTCVLGIDGKRCDKPLTPRDKSVESSADAVDTTNQKDQCIKKILTESGDVVCQP